MSRTIEEIKADIERVKKCFELLDKNECCPRACADCDYDVKISEIELIDELMEHYTKYEQICNAEREGRLVDAQELYNRLKAAEFNNPPTKIEDYAKGYNKAITDLTNFLMWEYGVKPLTKEEAEKALKGGAK